MLREDSENVYRLFYVLSLRIRDYKNAFSMVDIFLRDSCLGTFDTRLNSLRVMKDALPEGKLKNSVAFCVHYYAQFQTLLDQTITRLSTEA